MTQGSRLKWVGSLGVLLFASLAAAHTASAQQHEKVLNVAVNRRSVQPRLDIEAASPGDVLHLVVGHSLILDSTMPLQRVYIGDPAVLHSITSTAHQLVITAKAPGLTSMVVWDTLGKHSLYTVSADLDPEMLQRSVNNAFPTDNLYVAATQGRLSISGTVPSDAEAEAVLKHASLYVKDVINSLTVVPIHTKQVQLKLRIVEVDRTKLDQIGINLFHGGSLPASVSTQQFSAGTTTSAGIGSGLLMGDPLNLFLFSASQNIGFTLRDLEQKQILQVLAEPTLTTLSGQSARFLSGGEFPFPVVQGGVGTAAAITIMFRPYGVKVEFSPTVNADGTIRLKVSPEVSTLDYSNAVTISGFTIPAISTRRAETEVELQNGQSFIVSGLLDHRTTESLSKVPGIADVPIIGQFFRSKSINRSVVELVVVVTTTVVDPLTTNESPVEPRPAVPNMDSKSFDAQGKKASTAAPTGRVNH